MLEQKDSGTIGSVFGNDTTVGKCPVCLKNTPCECAFNSDDGISEDVSDWGLDFQISKDASITELLIDIKNELVGIRNLLQTKTLKEDLEAILKESP